MPLSLPRSSSYGGRIIDAFSFDILPANNELPSDPASVGFRSIADIMLHCIQRFVAADRELQDESGRSSDAGNPVLGNLGDSLPEPLSFVSNNTLST